MLRKEASSIPTEKTSTLSLSAAGLSFLSTTPTSPSECEPYQKDDENRTREDDEEGDEPMRLGYRGTR